MNYGAHESSVIANMNSPRIPLLNGGTPRSRPARPSRASCGGKTHRGGWVSIQALSACFGIVLVLTALLIFAAPSLRAPPPGGHAGDNAGGMAAGNGVNLAEGSSRSSQAGPTPLTSESQTRGSPEQGQPSVVELLSRVGIGSGRSGGGEPCRSTPTSTGSPISTSPGWSSLPDGTTVLSKPLMRSPRILRVDALLAAGKLPGACVDGSPRMEGLEPTHCAPLYCLSSSSQSDGARPSHLDVFISPFSLLDDATVASLHGACAPATGALAGSPAKRSAPLVSLVVTFKDKVDMTLQSLLELLRTLREADSAEFVLVDDGSKEDTSDIQAAGRLIERLFGVRFVLVRHKMPLGYGAANMAGVRAARGRYAVLLNNDVFVTPGWLTALLATAAEVPEAGIVGPLFVSSSGSVMEAGAVVYSTTAAANVGRGRPPSHELLYRRPVDYVSAACILVSRDAFLKVGGFDPVYGAGYWEDTDLAFAYWGAGYSVLYQPAALVVHDEGGTLSADKAALMAENRAIFHNKWGATLPGRACPPDAPLPLAAAQRQGPRLLWVDDIVPEPDRDSGSVRARNLLRLLLKQGYSVTFQPTTGGRDEHYAAAMRAAGVHVLPVLPPEQWAMRYGGACMYDAIIVARYYVYTRSQAVINAACPGKPLLFDTVDLHFVREARMALSLTSGWNFGATSPDAIAAWLESQAPAAALVRKTRDKELALVSGSAVTLVVADDEAELLKRFVPEAKVLVVSNVHELPQGFKGTAAGGVGAVAAAGVAGAVETPHDVSGAQRSIQGLEQQQQPLGRRGAAIGSSSSTSSSSSSSSPTEGAEKAPAQLLHLQPQPQAPGSTGEGRSCSARSGLLFVGNFNHQPNQQAVMALVHDVLPLLAAQLPPGSLDSMVLHIVGSNKAPQASLLHTSIPTIFHGWLSDAQLALLYGSVRVVVAPLLSGAGVKGKVNQAMIHGVPVVVTPVAAEGMHLVDGEDAMVASSAVEFADKLAKVYGDCGIWGRLVEGGRANVARWFSMKAAADAMGRALELAGVPRPDGNPRCSYAQG